MKKKITSKRNLIVHRCKPVAFFAMALAMSSGLNAQTWMGEALPESSGEYYLYNKGTGGFLVGGNTWGTTASVGDPGLLCTVALNDGKYSIQTFCSSNPDKTYLGSNGFIDANKANFEFTDVNPEDGLNEFTIGLDGKILRLKSGTALEINTGEASDENAQWLLVSKEQRIKALDAATQDNGVDASFYIVRPNFSRGEQQTPWVEIHKGGSLTLYGPDKGADSHNYAVEASGNESFDVYQIVTGLRNGRYVVSCQGFYRAGAVGTEDETANAFLYANSNQAPLQSLTGEDAPKDYVGATKAFIDGRYTGNSVEVIVTNGTLKMGVKKSASIEGDWSCFDSFRLTYYGEVSEAEIFNAAISNLQSEIQRFEGVGATTIVSELNTVYNENKDTSDYMEAVKAISDVMAVSGGAYDAAVTLFNTLSNAKDLLQSVEDGRYILSAQGRENLKTAIAEGETVLTSTAMAGMNDAAGPASEDVVSVVKGARAYIGLSYPLQTVKALADRIGGLNGTEEYKKVEADLAAADLTYDDMILDVQALNVLCQDNMTEEFLATANFDNPIDMTSFITNPNIFQNGESSEMPGGWTMIVKGSADNNNPTTEAHTDSQLQGYSWSGNNDNNIANIHYQQVIGGDEEGALKLPDGLYELSAATYVSAKGENIMLYATNDEINYASAWFNNDLGIYDDTREKMGTTTTVTNVAVNGGKLCIGVKGEGKIWVNGQKWLADNFRLSFISADALGAYRERLQDRLDEAVVLHDSLSVYGIDDSEYYGIALDPVDGYPAYMEEGTVEDVMTAIDELIEMNDGAKKVIDNYLVFYPMVTSGNSLSDQLSSGKLYAQPAVSEKFMTALEAAAIVAEDVTWDNLLSDKVTEQIELLGTAIKDLMNSMAICYPMGTAKELADQIGGLENHAAYKDVVSLLASDELDPLDVDMSVKDLQGACLDAMTPDVLAKASAENPLNMTTFVVNPNIYQDAVNDAGEPVNTVVNGWTCDASVDYAGRTYAVSGDTWLYCSSWSGHENINIASKTNYHQVVGTQTNEEGKFALPVGAYRVEAATFAAEQADKLELYARTHDVTVSSETNEEGIEVPVYTYDEIETAVGLFNGNEDLWNAAQATLGTTTTVNEIFVEKGSLTIGIKGNAVVSGNGKNWNADNFRLYYIGSNRGDGIEDTMMNAETSEAEIVDVYDLMGSLVRKQVKRADAVKGLKKGIYIAGGKKYVVTGK